MNANRTLAHELGHACGLNDIYLEDGNDVLVEGPCSKERAPLDWNNGTSSRYYPCGLEQSRLVRRLLMFGTTGNRLGVIPRGPVEGAWCSESVDQETGRKTLRWSISNAPVGLNSLNRQPCSQ